MPSLTLGRGARRSMGRVDTLLVCRCRRDGLDRFTVARIFWRRGTGLRFSGLFLSFPAQLIIALPRNSSGSVMPFVLCCFSSKRQKLLVGVLDLLELVFVAAQVRVVGRGKLAVRAMDFLIRRVGRDI